MTLALRRRLLARSQAYLAGLPATPQSSRPGS